MVDKYGMVIYNCLYGFIYNTASGLSNRLVPSLEKREGNVAAEYDHVFIGLDRQGLPQVVIQGGL